MSDVLTTHNLSKRYRKLLALDKLSLAVPEGSVYALLGANGAGKTTALKLMMNLHPATSGEATVLGIDSRQLQGRHFRADRLRFRESGSAWLDDDGLSAPLSQAVLSGLG